MTDTPRTKDELLSIFATNSDGAISSQNMRDFVASVGAVGPPFANHGFVRYFSASLGTLHTMSEGVFSYLTWDAASIGDATRLVRGRPDDWLDPSYTLDGDDPTSAWGVDVPAGAAFMLPTGFWQYRIFIGVTPALALSTVKTPEFIAYFDQIRWDPDFSGPVDGSAPYLYQTYATEIWRVDAPPYVSTGEMQGRMFEGLLVNDEPTPQPFGVVTHGRSASTLNSHFFTLNLIQTG